MKKLFQDKKGFSVINIIIELLTLLVIILAAIFYNYYCKNHGGC